MPAREIKLIPSGFGSGSGSCGCEADFAALRERLERLEREVSSLREKCGGPEGGCCTSKESKGAGCSIKTETDECPNECSDQGRCVDGKCVCFPGFSGPDCSESDCPGNCNDKGRCINGQCVCDPGFTGPDCSENACPGNCNNQGQCVNGKCVCSEGFSGPSCSDQSCPGNCNNKGRCVNGQCLCNPGFTGPDCSQRACPDNCSDRGRCVNGKCVCDSGFTGADCSENSCPGNCNNKGRCMNGQCVCNPGFTGPDCSKRSCPDNCNNRGRCVNGQCECESGFTGPSCSDESCPGNCNNRGRCVNGECVCDEGFGGPDCLEITCPNDCTDRGKCVDGRCECESGFTGEDCSQVSCPGNCNSRGRCVNGQCVCDDGFTGSDCSEKACPNNCSNRGKCVNGKCVCEVGFAGQDCGAKGCPGNCNSKGRCVKGRCVCRRGFKGPDCSQCEDGMTGPNCDTAMSGVSQLSTRDISETDVTLFWNPPHVQYDTYHLTFSSQKESEQQISVQVGGSLTSFTQTGLAAGQEYTVSISGEMEGRRGAERTAQFMTLISGPTNLRVVKTTSTTAVVQWEHSQGEIDRYRLTVTPSDGEGRSEELTIPPGQDSAHIEQLEAGRLYDIILEAEKGTSRSKPATTQVTPGKTLPRVSMAALTMRVTQAPGQDVGDGHHEVNPLPEVKAFDQQKSREDGSEADSLIDRAFDGPNSDHTTSVTARTKPLLNRKKAINGTRPLLYRRPNVSGPFRFNTTRFVPGWRKDPLKKKLVGRKMKAPIVPTKPKPDVSTIGERTEAELSVEASSTERKDDKYPAMMSGSNSHTNRQSSSEEPTAAVGSKEQPDVGMAGKGTDTALVSPEPTGIVQSQEKKCQNKVKVTHIRLPHRGKGSQFREDGTMLEGKTAVSDQSSFETDRKSAETNIAYSQDPLNKLLTDTFDSLNITTFSVHLSKSPDLSANAESVRKQIISGLKPLLSSSHSSNSQSSSNASQLLHSLTSKSLSRSSSSSSLDQSSAAPSSFPSSPSSRSSLAPSSSTAAPSSSSLTLLISSSPSSLPLPSPSQPSLSLPPSSSSLSSSDTGSVGSKERDVDYRRIVADVTSPEDRKPSPSGKGVVRRRHPKFGLLQNKTRPIMRIPPRSLPHLNLIPRRETETRHESTSEISSSPSSSPSGEPSSFEETAPVRDTSGDKNGSNTHASYGDEQNQKKVPTEREQIPLRRIPPKGGYMRRPNFGSLQNRTRPNSRRLPPSSRPLKPAPETRREQVSSTRFQATPSPLVSKASYPAEGTGPVEEDIEQKGLTIISHEFNQTLRRSGLPSSHRQPTKIGHLRQPQLNGGRFQNINRTNLRPLQNPHRGSMSKPFPNRKINGRVTVGGQIRPLGEKDTEGSNQGTHIDGHDTTVRTQIKKLKGGENAPIQTTIFREEETSPPDSNSDTGANKERVNTGININDTSGGKPTITQTSSDSRHGAPEPGALPKGQPPTRRMIAQHHTPITHYNSGRIRKKDKINNSGKMLFNSQPDQTRSVDPRQSMESDGSSSGVVREPLDYVGVTNQTSSGFSLIWDSPEEKYNNFVVTSKDVGKDEAPKPKSTNKDSEDDSEKEFDNKEEEAKYEQTNISESENGRSKDGNRVPESDSTLDPQNRSSTGSKPVTGSITSFKKVLPGSSRFFQFEDLPPQTEYTVTLLGKGPGLLSRLHKLVISTGPEPPKDLVFSEVTDNSLTVSWTKPKSPISGFKVTYTSIKDGEPMSVSIDRGNSTLGLSQLSPGSSYEVSVVSILGLDESDPIADFFMTLPDPPTDLRAVNVTNTKALLLWQPALAAVDKYAIVYGSGTDSELRVTLSGNAAEQQLSGLQGSTTYTITISSQLGSKESSEASTSFTTTSGSGGDGDGFGDLQSKDVTPRTARLSWKPHTKPAGSYRLTYQTEGQEVKEVVVDGSVTEFNLSRLHPSSRYTVQLQAESGGPNTAPLSTHFTTGTLRFPFPTDCSQELLNDILTSGEVDIFPQGRSGPPVMVYCDMETDGGGWTVFQRRKDGSVDFFRGWKEYIKGFGSLSGEFWLGLDNLYNLTSMTKMTLRVDLRDEDEAVFAKYSTFELVKRNYKLIVGGYSGTAGDSLSYHSQRIFSTKDRDLASSITRCAMSYRGGWWYKNCHKANLNGVYGKDINHQGVIWTTWKGKEFSIAFAEMKMRPAAFSPPNRG
ncbi:tenascin isoform X2 [Gymnodraco acuticeps]|uniref:Tenascin isoform X2 n=1 Tax=Gymnodraco acuticeps TaxID=8218 RepID=A0A6P8T1D9_GYMAC|nr:tenascin isoform X2 [Gymnodraco acuticeps]